MPPLDSWIHQVTAVDCPAWTPETVALKFALWPVPMAAVVGEMLTEIGGGAGWTVTVAPALFEGSAALVATTWKVPGAQGAV